MVRNAIQSDFGPPKWLPAAIFKKTIYKNSCASDLNNVRTDCWPTTTWYKFTFGQYIYIHTDEGTREYALCSPFRANAHNFSLEWSMHHGKILNCGSIHVTYGLGTCYSPLDTPSCPQIIFIFFHKYFEYLHICWSNRSGIANLKQIVGNRSFDRKIKIINFLYKKIN